MFSCAYCEFFQNNYFEKHLRTAASDYSFTIVIYFFRLSLYNYKEKVWSLVVKKMLLKLDYYIIQCRMLLKDQFYSNTRVLTQLNTNKHGSTRVWHESTRVNTNQHESDTSPTRVNTSPTRVNTNQHESDTSQHESTRVRHESTRINTSSTRIITSQHDSNTSQHEAARVQDRSRPWKRDKHG